MGSASEKDLARPASLGTVIPANDDDDYDDVWIFHKGIVPQKILSLKSNTTIQNNGFEQ